MQQQKLVPAYGITKVEYARQQQELEQHASQPSAGLFTHLRKKFR